MQLRAGRVLLIFQKPICSAEMLLAIKESSSSSFYPFHPSCLSMQANFCSSSFRSCPCSENYFRYRAQEHRRHREPISLLLYSTIHARQFSNPPQSHPCILPLHDSSVLSSL
jgi:hypothetical protein